MHFRSKTRYDLNAFPWGKFIWKELICVKKIDISQLWTGVVICYLEQWCSKFFIFLYFQWCCTSKFALSPLMWTINFMLIRVDKLQNWYSWFLLLQVYFRIWLWMLWEASFFESNLGIWTKTGSKQKTSPKIDLKWCASGILLTLFQFYTIFDIVDIIDIVDIVDNVDNEWWQFWQCWQCWHRSPCWHCWHCWHCWQCFHCFHCWHWRTIWHRTQFGTRTNLAHESIWHRTNLAPGE